MSLLLYYCQWYTHHLRVMPMFTPNWQTSTDYLNSGLVYKRSQAKWSWMYNRYFQAQTCDIDQHRFDSLNWEVIKLWRNMMSWPIMIGFAINAGAAKAVCFWNKVHGPNLRSRVQHWEPNCSHDASKSGLASILETHWSLNLIPIFLMYPPIWQSLAVHMKMANAGIN